MTGASPRPVFVIDGDCGFCSTSARFARRWVDRRRRYAIVPYQRLDLAGYGLTPEQCRAAAQFVDVDGTVRAGAAAISAGLTHGAPAWRPLGWVLAAPGVRSLTGLVYGWVAAHRHSLPGGTPACELPPPVR